MKTYFYNKETQQQPLTAVEKTPSSNVVPQKKIGVKLNQEKLKSKSKMNLNFEEFVEALQNAKNVEFIEPVENDINNNDPYDNSVLRLICNSESRNETRPYTFEEMRTLSSTAFPIKFKSQFAGEPEPTDKVFIVSNAHAVKDCLVDEDGLRSVKIITPGKLELKANVIAVNESSDLSLIQLSKENEHVFDNCAFEIVPKASKDINSVKIPKLGQKLEVDGFPFGFDSETHTKGRITSVSTQPYAHYGNLGLTYTTDAVVNEGNSGGPVYFEEIVSAEKTVDNNLADNTTVDENNNIVSPKKIRELSAVIFEGIGSTTSFMIPIENVATTAYRFNIQAAKKKKNFYQIDPFKPNLRLQGITEDSLREYYDIENNLKKFNYETNGLKLGVRVISSDVDNSNTGLKAEDIIVGVNGMPLLADQTVIVKGNPLHMDALNMFCNENDRTFTYDILRKNDNNLFDFMKVQHTLDHPNDYISNALCDSTNEYVFAGGITLAHLNIHAIQNTINNNVMPLDELYMLKNGIKNPLHKKCVVIPEIKMNKYTKEYMGIENTIIKEINGYEITSLTDAVPLIYLTDKFNNGFLTFKTIDDLIIALDFSNVEGGFIEANKKLMARNGIPSPGFNVKSFREMNCKCDNTLSMMKFNEKFVSCNNCNKQLAKLNFFNRRLELSKVDLGDNKIITGGSIINNSAFPSANLVNNNLVNNNSNSANNLNDKPILANDKPVLQNQKAVIINKPDTKLNETAELTSTQLNNKLESELTKKQLNDKLDIETEAQINEAKKITLNSKKNLNEKMGMMKIISRRSQLVNVETV